MQSRRRPLRGNGWESLEPRQLLAGDVFVSVADGHLLLRGDDAANQVAVWGTGNPGEVRIQGLAGTRLVGAGGPVAESALVVNGVSRQLTARLGGGDDLLQLDQLALAGTVRIDGGFGDDEVLAGVLLGERADADPTGLQSTDGVERLVLGGNLLIDGSYGDDVVEVGNVSVGGRLETHGHFGADRVAIGVPSEFPGTGTPATGTLNFAWPGSAASGTLTLSSGDTLNISAASAGSAFDDLTVVITDTGSGNSAVYDAGTNTVTVALDITGGDTTADLRSLISSLAEFNATSSGSAALQAGDATTFTKVTAGGADAGSDVITITADDAGASANGVTVTILEAASQGATPTAAFNGANIEVTLDDAATTAIAAIAAAIDSLDGYGAAVTTATGSGAYAGASSSPPTAATLAGGITDGTASFALSGAVRVVRDVFALLGWGDDQFQLDQATVEGGLFVDAGWGDDQVAVGIALAELGNGPLPPLADAVAPRATIYGAATVHGGWGDDDLRVVQAHVRGRLSVEAGAGDDNVALGRAITPVVQGGAVASGTLTFATSATSASGGPLALSLGAQQATGSFNFSTTGTAGLTITALAGGNAAGATGPSNGGIDVVITDSNATADGIDSATYNSGTNTITVVADLTSGSVTEDAIAAAIADINGGLDFTATAVGTTALVAGDAGAYSDVSAGGRDASTENITFSATAGEAGNISVTIAEGAGIGATPTVTDDGNGNYTVSVDNSGSTAISAIANALNNALLSDSTGVSAAYAGSASYIGSIDSPPGSATTLSGGAGPGNDVITITADDTGTTANGVTVTIIEAASQGTTPSAAFNGANIEVTVDDAATTTISAIASAIHGLAGYSVSVTTSAGSGVYVGASATPPTAATLSGGVAATPAPDDLEYDLFVSGALSVGLGAGDDVLTIRNVAVGGAAALPALQPSADPWSSTVRRRGARLALGFESLAARLARGRGTTATVRGGSGDDQVQIVDAAFQQLAVGLDNGDDALLLDGVRATLARLHGGSGVDALTTTERNTIARQTAESFATTTAPAAAAQTSSPVIRRRRR